MATKPKVYSETAKRAAKNLVPLYKLQQQDPDFRARFNRGMNPAIAQTDAMAKIHSGLDLAETLKPKETLSQYLSRLSTKQQGGK